MMFGVLARHGCRLSVLRCKTTGIVGFRHAAALHAAFINERKTCSVLPPTSNFTVLRFYASNVGRDNDDPGDGGEPEISQKDPFAGSEIEEGQNESPQGPMSTITVPDQWPIIPIVAVHRYPLFPGFLKKVVLESEESLKELIRRKIRMRQPYVGIFVKKDDETTEITVNSLSEIYSVGTFAHILEMREQNGLMELVLSATRCIRILEAVDDTAEDLSSNAGKVNERRTGKVRRFMKVSRSKDKETQNAESSSGPLILGKTENIVPQPPERTVEVQATMQAIVQTIRDIIQFNPLFGQQINLLLHPSQNVIDNPVYLCDLVGTVVPSADTEDLISLMEEPNIKKRLELSLILIQKEKTVAKLKHDISKDVEKKVQTQHRKFLLTEQLKAIKKELGIEKEDKVAIAEKLDERLKGLEVPEYVLKVIEEEQTKLSFLEPHSNEFSVCRNYLDWLTNLPWGKTSVETFDLDWAIKVLNEDHYGMKDVKDRILEFIAVGILKKKVGGKILCLHGPPGVGKTSIAKSISKALNREYYRFSVGGMTDVAEIKGHRRTYVGAMPGKMIQCLKKVQTENPLVLIDEVDKIGSTSFHGDPASALLELLDPEQNANFNDHFLDVPVDLSKVLFICTANVLDTIPGPLKDRMEMIEVSGYVAEEKVHISNGYLIPQCRADSSLDENQLQISPDALQTLIKQYCRESGVRNLRKHIEKIFRKAAFRIAKSDKSDLILVNNENLEEFLGRPKFTTDRLYDTTPVGVIMGLAWTAMGGSALYIEASLRRKLKENSGEVDSKGNIDGTLEATGHLGDVMKESMRTAYTVARNLLWKRFPENDFLESAHVHVHVPEGATPKDGPSAGCTITSALLSLSLNRSARQNTAMTGEITLTGRILPVGGIKEKFIAAKRAGVNCIILPDENRKDYDDLPDFIRSDVEVHFVTNYDQVFDIVFPDS